MLYQFRFILYEEWAEVTLEDRAGRGLVLLQMCDEELFVTRPVWTLVAGVNVDLVDVHWWIRFRFDCCYNLYHPIML